MFSFYFRQVLKPALLAVPSRGALNLHGSLLPRYRGRCPVNWVLVHGETETGVTLHYMERKPDAGDIVAQRSVPIADDDTALTLNRKLGDAARELLRVTFPRSWPVERRGFLRTTRARRRSAAGDRKTAASRGGARRASSHNLVRAVTHPYPGAFTTWAGTKLLVWKATPVDAPAHAEPGRVAAVSPAGIVVGTGLGGLLLEQLQLDGGAEERGLDFARHRAVCAGDRLGDAAC